MSEFFSDKETKCPHCGANGMDKFFMKKLDDLRRSLGRPVILNSAFRCKEHNAAVGGKPNSAHLAGMAADIKINNSEELWLVVKYAYRAGFARIGVGANLVHVDSADQFLPSPRMWTY